MCAFRSSVCLTNHSLPHPNSKLKYINNRFEKEIVFIMGVAKWTSMTHCVSKAFDGAGFVFRGEGDCPVNGYSVKTVEAVQFLQLLLLGRAMPCSW